MPIDDALNEMKKAEQNNKPEPEQITLGDYLKMTKKQKEDLDKLELYQIKEPDLEALIDNGIISSVIAKKYVSAQDELILGLKARVEPDKVKTMFNSGCGLLLYCLSSLPLMMAGLVASAKIIVSQYGSTDIPNSLGMKMILFGGVISGFAVSAAMAYSHIYCAGRKGKKFLKKGLETCLEGAHARYIAALASIRKPDNVKISVSYGESNQKIIDAALKLKNNTDSLDLYFNQWRDHDANR